MNRSLIILLTLLLAFLPFTIVFASDGNKENTQQKTNNHYEIYPLPQHEEDLGTDFTLTEEVNVVAEEAIDEPTMDFLREILDTKSLKVNVSDAVVSDKTNILIGTKNSDGFVDQYFDENIDYDEAVFNEIDPYVLTLDKNLEDKGNSALLRIHKQPAYYSLAMLIIMNDQMPEKDIHSMMYEEYPDTELRAFIVGFNVSPW